MLKNPIVLFLFSLCFLLCLSCRSSKELDTQGKPIIYQMIVRLFGNANTTNKYYGSIQENGVGKFNDINDKVLDSLKAFGITHIWYTGVLEHATMTNYSKYDIKLDDPDVVKGRAGSPYAIKDYYDVDPDLAVDVQNRIKEFQNLVQRTHGHGLKVLMDFIPNHVARGYFSDAKPDSVISFGAQDDTSVAFSSKNDFYYIPKTSFVVPQGVDAGGPNFYSKLKDGKFEEQPAKATGNNIFTPNPSINDWYETIKLNYGVDVQNGNKKYFNPIPPVWKKMHDILLYWAKKGIDGFRCDVAEMVPVEFWHWVIPQVKKVNPNIIFIAEAYTPEKYEQYLNYGHFDYLYNKVGLYDALKKMIKNDTDATVKEVENTMNFQNAFSSRMLNFLENHDEERIASKAFAGNPDLAKPAMVVATTISNAPLMIYFGQELGEKALGTEGFGGDDGKTTIFDYWSVPSIQQWRNGGKYDGGLLQSNQKSLRVFYRQLIAVANGHPAIYNGTYKEIRTDSFRDKQLAYLRYNKQETILVMVNFDRTKSFSIAIPLKEISVNKAHISKIKNLFTNQMQRVGGAVKVKLAPNDFVVLQLQ